MVGPGLDMGWRIALACLAWVLGIACQLQQSSLWPEATAASASALAGVLLLASGWMRVRCVRAGSVALVLASLVAMCLGLAMLGAATTDLRASRRLAETLEPAFEGQDLTLVGVVASLPHAGASGTRFVLEVESARLGDRSLAVPAQVPAVVALGWYLDDHDETADLFVLRPRA